MNTYKIKYANGKGGRGEVYIEAQAKEDALIQFRLRYQARVIYCEFAWTDTTDGY